MEAAIVEKVQSSCDQRVLLRNNRNDLEGIMCGKMRNEAEKKGN